MSEDEKPLINQLSLKDIIGGVLTAIIDGQSQALDNVIEFIERLSPTGEPGEDDGKYITFAYDRQSSADPSKNERVKLEVPLLSLLPIPYLAIKEAEIDFDYKISAVHKERRDLGKVNPIAHANTSNLGRSASSCSFEGSISPSSRLQSNTRATVSAQVNIKMIMKEENLGAGINTLMQEGEIAIQKTVTPLPAENNNAESSAAEQGQNNN